MPQRNHDSMSDKSDGDRQMPGTSKIKDATKGVKQSVTKSFKTALGRSEKGAVPTDPIAAPAAAAAPTELEPVGTSSPGDTERVVRSGIGADSSRIDSPAVSDSNEDPSDSADAKRMPQSTPLSPPQHQIARLLGDDAYAVETSRSPSVGSADGKYGGAGRLDASGEVGDARIDAVSHDQAIATSPKSPTEKAGTGELTSIPSARFNKPVGSTEIGSPLEPAEAGGASGSDSEWRAGQRLRDFTAAMRARQASRTAERKQDVKTALSSSVRGDAADTDTGKSLGEPPRPTSVRAASHAASEEQQRKVAVSHPNKPVTRYSPQLDRAGADHPLEDAADAHDAEPGENGATVDLPQQGPSARAREPTSHPSSPDEPAGETLFQRLRARAGHSSAPDGHTTKRRRKGKGKSRKRNKPHKQASLKRKKCGTLDVAVLRGENVPAGSIVSFLLDDDVQHVQPSDRPHSGSGIKFGDKSVVKFTVADSSSDLHVLVQAKTGSLLASREASRGVLPLTQFLNPWGSTVPPAQYWVSLFPSTAGDGTSAAKLECAVPGIPGSGMPRPPSPRPRLLLAISLQLDRSAIASYALEPPLSLREDDQEVIERREGDHEGVSFDPKVLKRNVVRLKHCFGLPALLIVASRSRTTRSVACLFSFFVAYYVAFIMPAWQVPLMLFIWVVLNGLVSGCTRSFEHKVLFDDETRATETLPKAAAAKLRAVNEGLVQAQELFGQVATAAEVLASALSFGDTRASMFVFFGLAVMTGIVSILLSQVPTRLVVCILLCVIPVIVLSFDWAAASVLLVWSKVDGKLLRYARNIAARIPDARELEHRWIAAGAIERCS